MSADNTTCDLLIIGASMAGSCLARQLKLKHPDMNIVQIERKTEFAPWVGESTLESFWDYAVRHLDLGHYLDTHHLYKHGLRFFFDSPKRDLPIERMSEAGRSWFHGTPSHQLDRKRFDTDMCEMNRALGVDVRLGCKVKGIELDVDHGHLVDTSQGRFRCTYLVDAAGFASPLGRKLNLIESLDHRHPVSAYWARFKHTANLDLLGDMEWRSRVCHTSRFLSTVHFMYRGYWIWVIPLNKDTVSIGVTMKTDMTNLDIKDGHAFIQFLHTHQCMRQLITPHTEIQGFHRMKRLARRAKQTYSTQRWFLTGMAAAFMDPLLSPGSAFLSDTNRMIGDLIATDRAGRSTEYADKVIAYNNYSRFWFESFLLHVRGNYHGIYDLHRVHFQALLMHCFGIILPTSMSEQWGYDPGMTGITADQAWQETSRILDHSAIKGIHNIQEQLHRYLRERDCEHGRNSDQFWDIELGKEVMKHTRTSGRHLNKNKKSRNKKRTPTQSRKGHPQSRKGHPLQSRKGHPLRPAEMWVSRTAPRNTHFEEVTNYFIARHTSGFVEGLNSKIKVIKRRCYGITNLGHLYQRVFLDLNGYDRFGVDTL
ncbi:MAG: hypothetical protein N838_31500 [Thiohalocapsa sp. PB-PSB1]|jgi:FADH2 O2-dependent halogenase|nr:MAG: hypothetical protein N838_31500 [Thiohalocapsa sp. PB-PSB1]